MTLSIVSPVYNSANTIYSLIAEIDKATTHIAADIEIILVNDGSSDSSWETIEKICANKANVKAIKLDKNYGQHQAIRAGLENVTGDWIVVLDCDLQDNPAEITRLYEKAIEGYDIVMAKRMNRKDAFLKKLSSFMFWKTISFLGNANIHPLVGNFGIYHKNAIAEFISLKDSEAYFSIAMQKLDFRRTLIEAEHQTRLNKNSSYSFFRLVMHAANVLIKTCGWHSGKSSESLNYNYVVEKKIN